MKRIFCQALVIAVLGAGLAGCIYQPAPAYVYGPPPPPPPAVVYGPPVYGGVVIGGGWGHHWH
jgi:hypothetical protein